MNLKGDHSLNPKQEMAIIALLNEPTVRKAAESIGIADGTLHGWLNDPAFATAYRRARRQAFNQAIAICQRYVPLAVQSLTKIMVDESAPHSARVSAATALLKFSRESIELDEMHDRIAAIEEQLNGVGPDGGRKQVVNQAQGSSTP